MSGQAQILSAEMGAVVRARSATAVAVPSLLRYGVLYALGGVLVFVIATFGAVEPWSLFGFQAMAAGLLVLWAVHQLVTGAEFVLSPLYVPVSLFAAIVGGQLLLHRTAYAYMTRSTSLTYMAYAMILLVAVQMLRTQEELKRLAGFFTVFGFLLAIFAVIQDLTSKNEIYWLVPVRAANFIFGPYVNHNHYAGIMEMLVPFPLVLSMMEELTPPKRVLLAFAGVFMAGTIFLSLSRGGMTAFGFEVVFLAAVLWWKNASRRSAAIFRDRLSADPDFPLVAGRTEPGTTLRLVQGRSQLSHARSDCPRQHPDGEGPAFVGMGSGHLYHGLSQVSYVLR